MSAVAVDSNLNRTARFYQATIGKKVVMAVTGIILFGFVLAHMLGNLQIYLGREVLDHYAVSLRQVPALLWGARAVLLLAVVLHIWTAIQLAALKKAARPVGYVKKDSIISSYAARTMYWSGPILAAFIVYHLLQFTFGKLTPEFEHLKPYENVVAAFSNPLISLVYIVAMVFLCLHLYHGLWSMFQSLGANHPKYSPLLRRFAAIFSILILLGNISIPISVMLGVVPKP
ncbi:MAG TPA: succinate dehydrogenase cytochrome b subunit [Bryobacteraceae bacterium]|nr:succinate dehydrogenase cytochrome b subunit [Bryobacteraceae bacterium]